MRMAGVAERFDIGAADLRRERRAAEPHCDNASSMMASGTAAKDAFGQRLRLGKQRPGPEAQRQPGIGALPCRLSRHDIQDGEPADAVRMVESHAIGDAAAAIVPGDEKPPMAKLLHQGHHVPRHGALRIGRVVGAEGGQPLRP